MALWLLSLLLTYPFDHFLYRANASFIPAERTGLLWWETEEGMNNIEKSDNWKDIRKARLKRKAAIGEVKRLFLCRGLIPFMDISQQNMTGLKGDRDSMRDKANVWVRDGSGLISQPAFNLEKDEFSIDIPEDLEQNGLYLLGAHLDVGKMDMDSSSEIERIHLCAKRIIKHRKTGGRWGNKLGVSFNDPDKLPLEIGFSDTRFRHDYQRAHREYKMKVIYQGKPLADIEVKIFSKSGWEKTVRTDSSGEFLMTPFGNKEQNFQEAYLYVAAYHDLLKNEYYNTTLIMKVITFRDSRSKSSGFMLWTVLGTGLLVVIIMAGMYRKRKYDRETMLIFESQRIKRS